MSLRLWQRRHLAGLGAAVLQHLDSWRAGRRLDELSEPRQRGERARRHVGSHVEHRHARRLAGGGGGRQGEAGGGGLRREEAQREVRRTVRVS